jgi:hypothetical protein
VLQTILGSTKNSLQVEKSPIISSKEVYQKPMTLLYNFGQLPKSIQPCLNAAIFTKDVPNPD